MKPPFKLIWYDNKTDSSKSEGCKTLEIATTRKAKLEASTGNHVILQVKVGGGQYVNS